LERLENDYQSWDESVKPFWQKLFTSDKPATYPELVKNAMTFLWASRHGLTETELLKLLDVPQAIWSPLYLALQTALVNRAGLLNFANDYLRQAVEQRYLTGIKQQVHSNLANLFESLPMDSRKADELPYQLEQAGAKERLLACISEIPMFLQFIKDERLYELLVYWRKLNQESQIATIYLRAISEI